MDCSNFEKSKGFQSKIPVRAIKPPSRLPVLIATKENESRKNHKRPNPSAIENVSTKAPVKTNSKAILAPTSRKGLLSLQHTRYGGRDPVKTVTNRRLTNVANPTVNKKSISSGLQANVKATKLFSQPANKKPLNKEIVTENRRLTSATCRNQNEKPTRGKTNDNNKRFTNISNKESTLLNKKSTAVQRNIENRNIANVDKIETKRLTNFGFPVNLKKERPVKQAIGKLPRRGSTLANKPADNLNIRTMKADVNNRKDVSLDQEPNCPFDFQDPPHSFGKTKEQINHEKEFEVKQPNKKVPSCRGSVFANKAAVNLNATKVDVNCKKDVSCDQEPNCPFGIPVPPYSVDNMKEDKDPFFQPNVEFVADERYRNQILFGQGISPDSKPKPVKNSLISDTPSFFLKSKTALRALEKLEEEGRRISMLRMSGLCPNSLSRPSRAMKTDPYQTVLRALENVDLAAEDRRVSAMKKNNIYVGSPCRDGSPMLKQQVDPYKTALKKIEALQMKRKAKSTKKVTFNLEPSDSASKVLKQSGKSHTNILYEVEVNDVITEKKTEDKDCSISKLEPKISSPKPQLSTKSSADNMERNLPKSHYQDMLLRICGQADTRNKSELPNKQDQSMACIDRLTSVSNLNSHSTMNNVISPYKSTLLPQNALKMASNISDSVEPCFRTRNRITSLNLTSGDPRYSLHLSQPQTVLESDTRRSTLSSCSLSNMKNKSSPPKPILLPQNTTNISESVGPCFRTLNRITSLNLTSGDPRYSLHLSRPQTVLESDTRSTLSAMKKINAFKNPNIFTSSILASEDPRCSLGLQTTNTKRSALTRLCTPKPISFFPKPCATDSISPEFLCRRTSRIVANPPISTPMVMRTLAANLEETLSPAAASQEDDEEPVCQRLDFDEVEREGARESLLRVCGSPSKIRRFPIQSIRTNQQVLDSLADEECCTILSIASFPVITERSVWNPVAQILTSGDDMHFVPVKLK